MDKLVLEKSYIKLLCLYLVQHLLHQIKAQQFYTDLDFYQQCKVLQEIEEFKDFSTHLSDFLSFQGIFNFQGLFKKAPNSSTFQAYVNPEL